MKFLSNESQFQDGHQLQSIFVQLIMLHKQLSRAFSRLIKFKTSKYNTIFSLLRDQHEQIEQIELINQQTLSNNKQNLGKQELANRYKISEESAQAVSRSEIYAYSYDTVTHKKYQIKQQLLDPDHVEIIDTTDDVSIPFALGNHNLKFHYSINREVSTVADHPITTSTAYIFNLPEDTTNQKLMLELGFRFVKSVDIHYCMLGLPAYAVAEFLSENSLADKMAQGLLLEINDRKCEVNTYADRSKLRLNHRQLVVTGIEPSTTHADILKRYSDYGRLLDIDYPTEIYREPSLSQVKEIYQHEKHPIKINYHHRNGTIESEYYPEFRPSTPELTAKQRREEQNLWRTTYCENLDVFEGQQNLIKIRGKGYCTITYSCQEEAQNCYFRESQSTKMKLRNGAEQFQFDTYNKEALLRFIDNSCIEAKKRSGEAWLNKCKFEDELYQNLYRDMTVQKVSSRFYDQSSISRDTEQDPLFEDYHHFHEYRKILADLKDSIGAHSDSVTTAYGKSFSQLAEREIYEHQLNSQQQQRYEVNIDDYMQDDDEDEKQRRKSAFEQLAREEQERAHKSVNRINDDEAKVQDEEIEESEFIDGIGFDINDSTLDKIRHQMYNQMSERIEKQQAVLPSHLSTSGPSEQADDAQNDGKRHFSTTALKTSTLMKRRPKTLEEKVRSHVRYNKFIRNTINEYLGVFSQEKLESEFYRRKPTFTNPQNLTFADGSPFLPETYSQIQRIMEFSTCIDKMTQNQLSLYVKQSEEFKSMNYDVEENILKDFEGKPAENAMLLSDMGIIKEEFSIDGKDPQQTVDRLNHHEAQFGEEYRIVRNEETNEVTVAKIAKLQNIYPMHIDSQMKAIADKFMQSSEFSEQQFQLIKKFMSEQQIADGQQFPEEICQAFGVQKGRKFSLEALAEEVAKDGFSNKDTEKIVNLLNFTHRQISEDVTKQMLIEEARTKLYGKKASDYSRDPSEIYVKDRDGRFRVSKFRQM